MNLDKKDVLDNINFQDFYSRKLNNFKPNGNGQATSQCPLHQDTHNSCSINTELGLWNCFVCNEGGDIFKFVMLTMNKDFKDSVEYLGEDSKWYTVTPKPWDKKVKFNYGPYWKERWERTDENGKREKIYYFFHLDGEKLRKSGRGSTAIPYNLSAAQDSPTIWWVEGEHIVDWAKSIGIVAISLDSGANSKIPELNEMVEGKRIVICPDNDKVGKDFGFNIANACLPLASEVKILDPEKLMVDEKGDLIDWKDQNDNKDKSPEELKAKLVKMVIETPRYEREDENPINMSNKSLKRVGENKNYLHFRDHQYDDVLSIGFSSLEGRYGFVKGLWTAVCGVPGNGKSTWVETVMCNLAKLHGLKGMIYPAESMPIERWVLNMVPKWTGQSVKSLSDKQFLKAIEEFGPYFIIMDPKDNERNIDWILAMSMKVHQSKDGPLDYIVVDPWSELDHNMGNIQETLYISEAITKIRSFSAKTGIHSFIINHPTKPNYSSMQDSRDYTKITPHQMAGSASWFNKADFVVLVSSPISDNGERGDPTINIAKVRFKIHGKVGPIKLKYNPNSEKFEDPPRTDNSILI